MTDLHRLREVTTGYPYLQGLKLVPIGLLVLVVAIVSTGWWPWEGWGSFIPIAVAGIALVAALARVGEYYERRFGRVAPTRAQLRRDAIGTTASAVAVGIALLVDATWAPPVSVFGLAIAAMLLWYWSWSGGPRSYHWPLAGALVVASVLPPVARWIDLDLVGPGEPALTLVLAVTGAVYTAAGLLDHSHLVRSVGPVVEDRDADSA